MASRLFPLFHHDALSLYILWVRPLGVASAHCGPAKQEPCSSVDCSQPQKQNADFLVHGILGKGNYDVVRGQIITLFCVSIFSHMLIYIKSVCLWKEC